MTTDRGLGSQIAALLLFIGVAILLVAVLLAVLTTAGWPKLTLTAFVLLVIGMLLAAREMRTPS
jgi:hypothetical protein